MALRPTPPQTREQQLAARQAEQGEAFLREVDDALREDQTLLAIKRYAKPVGAGLALGLAALAGWLYWGHYQDQQAEARAEQLTIAMDQIEASQNGNASKTLEALAAGKAGASAVIARLVQAGVMVQTGKPAEAAKLYATIAAQSDAPQPYRDFATLRQVALSFDTMKPEEVVARLKPLAAPGGAWFGEAGELLAVAYLKQGKNDLAAPLFGAIAKDKQQPESLRARARQMAGMLGYDSLDDIAPAAEMAPQAPAGTGAAGSPAAGSSVAPKAE